MQIDDTSMQGNKMAPAYLGMAPAYGQQAQVLGVSPLRYTRSD